MAWVQLEGSGQGDGYWNTDAFCHFAVVQLGGKWVFTGNLAGSFQLRQLGQFKTQEEAVSEMNQVIALHKAG